jgi:mRNA-degrading endonuclease RelE of RelBE toxin-antitoxin system
MHKVILHRNAAKSFQDADKKLQQRITDALDSIAENPYYSIHIKKLHGELASMYRYRLGPLRILYEIHQEIKTVRIKTIESRGSAYK